MNLKKKIITFVMICIYLLPSFSSLAAETVLESDIHAEQISLMQNLGVLPNSVSELDLSKELKRGDFATIVSRFSGVESYAQPSLESSFSDVTPSDFNYSGIMLSTSFGYMSGVGGGMFDTESKVTYNQAVKVMMSILGYDELAALSGGYPSGYIILAKRIGILNEVKPFGRKGDKITTGDIIQLMYNVLDAPVLKYIGTDGDSAHLSQSESDTFLKSVHKLTKCDGVVRGVHGMIADDRDALSPNQILIDSNVYKIKGENDYSEYFGFNVVYYIDSEDKVVTVSDIESDSYKIDLKFEDIENFSYDGLTYYDGYKEKKVKFSKETDFIHNGVPRGIDSFDDILLKDGRLSLIFADDNSVADFVYICTSQNYVVKKVNSKNETIYDMYSGGKFDASLLDSYTFVNEYGVQMYFEELNEYDVISVIQNDKEKTAQLYYSNTEIDGEVNSIKIGSTSYITIDEREYRVASSFARELSKLSTGDSGVFVMDIFGNIASYSAYSGHYEYGYIAAASKTPGLDSTIIVKLFDERGAFSEIPVSDKIIIDGVKKKASDAWDILSKAQLVRYYKWAGNLKAIDTVQSSEGGTDDSLEIIHQGYDDNKQKVSQLGWCLSQNILSMRVPVDDSTKIFLVPSEYTSDEKQYSIKKSSYFVSDGMYYVNAYTSGDRSFAAQALVLYDAGKGSSITEWTSFTVVDKVTAAISEDGDICTKVYGFKDGKSVCFIIDDSSVLSELKSINPDTPGVVHNLRCGDIIKVSASDENVVNEIILYYDYAANVTKDNITIRSDVSNPARNLKAYLYEERSGYYKLVQKAPETFISEPGLKEYEIINATLFTIYKHNVKNGEEFIEVSSPDNAVDFKSGAMDYSELIMCARYNNAGMLLIR